VVVARILVDAGNLDKAGIPAPIDCSARIVWPRRSHFYWRCQVIEKSHAVEITHRTALAFCEVEPHPAGGEGELIGQRQKTDRRVDHHLAAGRKPDQDVIHGGRMRISGGANRAF